MKDKTNSILLPSLQSNLPPKIISPADAINAALNLYNNGKLNEAENILTKLVNSQPKNATAIHLLGVVLFAKGNIEAAIKLIKQAIEISPKSDEFYSNIAEMLRKNKQIEEAIKYGEKAVELAPKSASALSNLGLAYYDNKEFDKAEELQKKAFKISNKSISALNNLGSIYRDKKEKDLAIEYYKRAVSIAPNHIEALNNLGVMLNELDKPNESINILIKVIKLAPRFAEAHSNIANAFLSLEQFDKALIGYKKALEIKSNYIEAMQGVAKCYKELQKYDLAEDAAKKALEIDPNKAELHSILGEIYSQNGYPKKSEKSYKEAIELKPDSATAYLGLGHLQMEIGKMKEAEKSFNKASLLEKDNIGSSLALVQVKKVKEEDEHFKKLIIESEKLDTMIDSKAVSLHFALGKCYDDTKNYDLAFKHYLEGANLKRKAINYSAENTNMVIENICKFFTRQKIYDLRGAGCDSSLPIFVLGMPRSGTTLTEQIIASHPLVHGAGELPDLMKIACEPFGVATEGYPLSLYDITKADLKLMGEKYVKDLQARNPKAKFITDKMPANFNALGLIHLMLPNAKIIHVKRNAVDTCLSGFTKLFNKSQFHSYDLFEIGNYYRNYAILMDHWRKVLPENSFYEVQYEDLVSDNENQARKLIEFCGLEWNDACLESHKTERSIKTASVTQVRQPIYTSSVERWRKYEKHLQPLLDVLGELAYK